MTADKIMEVINEMDNQKVINLWNECIEWTNMSDDEVFENDPSFFDTYFNSPSVRDFLNELEYQYLHEIANDYYGFDEENARDLADANGYEYLEDGTLY